MFIGKHEILSEKEVDGFIEVTTDNGVYTYSKAVLDNCRTEEPSDASTLRLKRCELILKELSKSFVPSDEKAQVKMVKAFLKKFIEHNLRFSEVDFVMQTLAGQYQAINNMIYNTVKENEMQAGEKLWGMDDQEIDFHSANKILTS